VERGIARPLEPLHATESMTLNLGVAPVKVLAVSVDLAGPVQLVAAMGGSVKMPPATARGALGRPSDMQWRSERVAVPRHGVLRP
jgi:hypothetical protein